MNAGYVMGYMKKMRDELNTLSIQESIPVSRLWLDSVWSFLRYGCTIRQYVTGNFYRYSSFERKKILTTKKFFKLVDKTNNKAYIKYLEDKALFNELFHRFVHRKWVDSRTMKIDDFMGLCSLNESIIVKPVRGTEGDHIYVLDDSELNTSEKKDKLFGKLLKQNVILEEVIVQHPKMVFNNSSVNTIRVITLMSKNSNCVDVIKAVLRVGVGDTVVDNYHQGGCCYEVDLKSGRVCTQGVSRNSRDIVFHPGSNICMLGYELPLWNEVISACKEAHLLLPQCRYISWDVAITSNGVELIEGNHNGDYDMLEFVGRNGFWPVLKKYI